MNHNGDFLCQSFLKEPFMWSFAMRGNNLLNFLLTKDSKYFDVFCRIFIRYIKPELVELIRCGFIRIEPYISRLCFAEFCTIRFCYQRTSECEGFPPCFSADKLSPCYNISPLIGATHLKLAAIIIIKMKKISSLHKLVRKFSK